MLSARGWKLALLAAGVILISLPAAGDAVPASAEALELGIDGYWMDIAEIPEITLLDEAGNHLGELTVRFGEDPGEQRIEVILPERGPGPLTVHWKPSAGWIEVIDETTGERGRKTLTAAGWAVESDVGELFSRFERQIAWSAVAVHDYLRYIGHED